MNGIRRFFAIIVIAALCLCGAAFAEQESAPALSFATIGEALESDGYTGVAGGDGNYYSVLVEIDGAYIRLVAELDEEAARLNGEITKAAGFGDIGAAFEAYDAHVKTLPIVYEEEFTAAPKTREELDALVGKTLPEVEEAGYEYSSSEMSENDEVIYYYNSGLYKYALVLNVTSTEYMENSYDENPESLTVKSAEFAGLSLHASELRYHADGTVDEEVDSWSEYSSFVEQISNALASENPEEAIQMLIDSMPEQADEIRAFAQVFSAMNGQATE